MKCIIVEGPQGCGKSSLTNYLRDNIASSNLYRLSGIKDKTISGKAKSKKMYLALLNYMRELEESEINLIFDRTFFSDYVYAKLGYKEYDYEDVYQELLQQLGKLKYDIYYLSLYLKDSNLYKERLNRKHHNYQAFSIKSSLDQQQAYHDLLPSIKALKNTKVYEIAMDDFDVAYEEINKILQINNS